MTRRLNPGNALHLPSSSPASGGAPTARRTLPVRGGCGRTSREIRDTACMLWWMVAAVVVALCFA